MNDVSKMWKEAKQEQRFVDALSGAEMHWFFIQGLKAIRLNLHIPAASSLLNGIEASIRITYAQLSTSKELPDGLSPFQCLSNKLIKQANEIGMPVELLSFPEEDNFFEKLQTKKPNLKSVEIVRQRNNICHGNILEFAKNDLGDDNVFLTPECLREFNSDLLEISFKWADGLGQFREENGLRVQQT